MNPVPIQGMLHMSAYGAADPQAPLLPFLPATYQREKSGQELWLGCPCFWLHWGWSRTGGLIAGMEAPECSQGRTQSGNSSAATVLGPPSPMCMCVWGEGLGLWPWQAVAAPLTQTTLSPCPLLPILIRLPGAGRERRLQLAPGSHWRSS